MLINLSSQYAPWLPGRLFANGQQGVWYVPQPVYRGDQVLYQDDAGTTPVAADGDPVGLGLERSKGLERGPETVVNGDFSDGTTGWVLGSNWTVSDGEITTSAENSGTDAADSTERHAKQAGILEVGKSYQITLDIVGNSQTGSGFSNLLLYSEGGLVIQKVDSSLSAPRAITFFFTATSTDFTLSTSSTNDGQEPFTLDNISVRELPGNHLTQPTSADRPTYNTDGSLHWLAHDGAGDNLKSTYATAVAQPCTLSVAIDKQDTGADKVIATGLSSTDRHQISINASGNLVAIAGSTTLDSGQALANGKHIVTVVLDGANSSIRVDGASIATGDLGADSSGGLTLSSLWDGTLSIVQDVYGAIHAEGVDDVGRVESYLNDRIGGNVL